VQKQFSDDQALDPGRTAADIHGWLSTDDVDVALMYDPECGPELKSNRSFSEPCF
jgi:hypothetical protein